MQKESKHFGFLILLLYICSTPVQANTCPNDNWGEWDNCLGCLRSQRRVCKTNNTVYQEEPCKIGMYLVLSLCLCYCKTIVEKAGP